MGQTLRPGQCGGIRVEALSARGELRVAATVRSSPSRGIDIRSLVVA
jgi:hypothetical protein